MKTENRFTPWKLADGATVTPLAFDLPLMSWGDLDDAQQKTAIADCCVDPENAADYFIEENTVFVYLPASENNDATLFYMSDCMRLNGCEAAEHFDGYFSESAFSMIVLKLSDDSDFVHVARVAG